MGINYGEAREYYVNKRHLTGIIVFHNRLGVYSACVGLTTTCSKAKGLHSIVKSIAKEFRGLIIDPKGSGRRPPDQMWKECYYQIFYHGHLDMPFLSLPKMNISILLLQELTARYLRYVFHWNEQNLWMEVVFAKSGVAY